MVGKHSGALDVPPIAARGRDAVEVARVWVAEGGQHVSLRPEAWPDLGAWGILLVDLARHLARAYQLVDGRPREETMARIRELFEAEWDRPTDDPKGELLA